MQFSVEMDNMILLAVNRERVELFAMVNERWSATHVPVLVLSCIKDDTCARLPCIEVVDALRLATLNRPWQVRKILQIGNILSQDNYIDFNSRSVLII